MHTTIIDCQTLRRQLANPNWLLLDCRFNLADVSYGERAYAAGHIPGACYLHLDHDLSSPVTPESGRHPLPEVEKLAAKLVSLGLNADTQVVAYDDCGGAMAVRAWWLLRWLGHEAVAVLDGGFPEWMQQQGMLETVMPTVRQSGNFQPRPQAGFIVEARQLRDSSEWLVVDARAPERFRGELEPIDPIAGTIPGAVNRPLTDNLCNGLFKPAEQLRAEWGCILHGIDPGRVAHMCGSGVTACHNQLALEIAGITGTRLYSGSWSEWIRDPGRPVYKQTSAKK
ncbi:sulfurtransferase [Candidatus Thiothrix sp. Deng01]|uniref:Sulfurtransferase n=1 Tax=Candidatus Thiothrix phosphatis TaxID=3112415 RepID=A0ABU6CY67_9GAMM|nr:sulfurtransferase [Candidatus Thiothrix sp. Deng01]MEB4591777.1 sulfurtransferase [Candidatus Thiothrix sp. Deng01]